MKKVLICFMLILALAFAMTSCDNKKDKGDSGSNNNGSNNNGSFGGFGGDGVELPIIPLD